MKDPFYGKPPYNLMIVRMSALGDICHALPAYHALRRHYPRTKMYWLVDSPYKPLLERTEGLREVVAFDRPKVTEKLTTLQEFWRAVGLVIAFVRRLYRINLTGAINFQPLLRSGFFTFATLARVRLGFCRLGEGNWFLMNKRVKVSKNQHVVRQNMKLLEPLGLDPTPERVSLRLEDEDRRPVEDFMKDYGIQPDRMVVFNPGSSKRAKEWTVEGWARLGDRLAAEENLVPVIAWGSEREEKTAKAIIGEMKEKALLAPDLRLPELAALLTRARLVVAPDTGPLHLASLQGTPVVGLYGPTNPAIHGPFWEPHRVVQADSDCKRPCYRKRNNLKTPCACMRDLSDEAVYLACRNLLQDTLEVESKQIAG